MTDQELFALVDDVRELRSRVRLLEAQVQSLQIAAPREIPKAEPAPGAAEEQT